MAYRSHYLVHWTGHDLRISTPSGLNAPTRTEYVNRLSSILDDGFWMTPPEETLYGDNESQLDYRMSMTCFTEVRLSQAAIHAAKYGLLGIVVDRLYVLNRYGGPVQYVRNSAPESVVETASVVWGYLEHLANQATPPPLAGFDPAATTPAIELDFLQQRLSTWISFMKPMSNETDDFSLLEEMEWRIVASPKAINLGGYTVPATKPPPIYRLPVQPDELRGIVFPDDHTRIAAAKHPRIADWLGQCSREPWMLTLDECGNF